MYFKLYIKIYMTVKIKEWYGRLGNNIIQLTNAIKFSIQNNHNKIIYPKHNIFEGNEIIININNNIINNEIYCKNFFTDNPVHMTLEERRDIALKYLRPIISKINIINSNKDDLYIHIRSGDIFSSCPHKLYVQPPLAYYEYIINSNNYKNIFIVAEDKLNPVINKLLENKNYKFISGSLQNDIGILLGAYNLCIGIGSFGYIMYYLSDNLTNFYIPSYNYTQLDNLHTVNTINNININTINIPNYIKVGEWKNTNDQRKKMIEYKLPIIKIE